MYTMSQFQWAIIQLGRMLVYTFPAFLIFTPWIRFSTFFWSYSNTICQILYIIITLYTLSTYHCNSFSVHPYDVVNHDLVSVHPNDLLHPIIFFVPLIISALTSSTCTMALNKPFINFDLSYCWYSNLCSNYFNSYWLTKTTKSENIIII